MEAFKLISAEYASDIESYRKLFASVNPKDLVSLKKWFDDHPYLTIHDHAIIAKVDRRTIWRWRHLTGQTKRRGGTVSVTRSPVITTATAPANWRTFEWLNTQYRTKSIRQIAVMVGRSYVATRNALLAVGVQLRDNKTIDLEIYRRRDWLIEAYVNRGLSQSVCARLAGVSRYRIETWLHKLNVMVRTVGEQCEARRQSIRAEKQRCHRSG